MKSLKLVLFSLIVFLGVSSYAKAAPLSQVPRILYVMEGKAGDCLKSWATACELQTAMVKANPGDQIWVAEGTYKPTRSETRTATFQLESGVAIYGGFSGEELTRDERNWVDNITTLSGDIGVGGSIDDNSYHVVTSSGVDATAIMDGFTVSGGNANGTEPHNYGGGMYNTNNSNPTLTNVTFTNNSAAYYGGGMYNFGSNPILTNVTFTENSAAYYGGGMYNDYGSPILTNVAFTENTATDSGGGMVNTSSSPMLTDVTFTKNTATVGGGMVNESSNPTLTYVTFSGNRAGNGGGMVNNFSRPTLTNVTFTENRAFATGGGMINWSSSPTLTNATFTKNSAVLAGGMSNESSHPMLTNVTFSENSATYGGGMVNNFSGPTLTNVTFTKNSADYFGGGMHNESSNPTLANAIVWENTPTPSQIYNDGNSFATITYSDIEGGFDGDGNINDDPHLGPLADNGGFTQTHALGVGSPAIDAAYSAFCPTYDQRFYARPIDGDGNGSAICDMGAFEYGSSVDGFTLTVTVVGDGSVTKIPDKTGYLYGEKFTLIANPGWTFIGWSGDATGTANPLTMTIQGNTNITANFTNIYKLYLPLILKN